MDDVERLRIEQLNRATQAWGDRVGARLQLCLTPLYKEGPRHPELFGSGILLRAKDLTFLLTAAHVAEQVTTGPHYFGANDELLPLGGLRMTSPLAEGATREKDRLDLAYWVLSPHIASRIPSQQVLRSQDLDFDSSTEAVDGLQYFVNGYPASRQPRRLTEEPFEARPFAYITEEMSASEYRELALGRVQNLFVAFDKADTYRLGDKVQGPDLFGVSGGALWRLSGGAATMQSPKLAGIIISWRTAEPKGIIATRTHVIVAHLASQFPNVR